MPLSNAQYDEIMRSYDERQLQNRRVLDKRRAEVFAKIPRLAEIDAEVAALSVRRARALLGEEPLSAAGLKAKLSALSQERKDLLASGGFAPDYLEPVYTCKDCRDTGYIDGKKCHCFQQAIINTVYAQSNIRSILQRENFDAFRLDYYTKDEISPTTGKSSYDTAVAAVAECRHFIDDFDRKPKNLLFYGKTGVGKTFLSNCVAHELLESGRSVIYFTAFQLFDILSKGIFEKDADAIAAHRNIFDCDLLVIDDLGTELNNAFTSSQFFLCVNERLLRQRSTIISTNLNVSEIAELYSERTLSRILDAYTMINLFVGVDIRNQKRRLLLQR